MSLGPLTPVISSPQHCRLQIDRSDPQQSVTTVVPLGPVAALPSSGALTPPRCEGALAVMRRELADRARIQGAIVAACRKLAAAGPGFEVSHSHRFSAECWLPIAESGCGAFELRPGVAPSQAVLDITAHPRRYEFDCGTAMVVAYYMAMLDLLGAETFDRVCADVEIGPWWLEQNLANHLDGSGDSSEPATLERRRELQPGDHTYFRNWDVSEAASRNGWNGENVIYLGNGEYYGHPFGICGEQEIVDHLNGKRRLGGGKSAAMTDFQIRLNSNILLTR